MAIPAKTTLFPAHLRKEIINGVMGHSSIAKLCGQTPLDFNGNTEFVFTLDDEMDIVAENGAKSAGGATIAPITVMPIKFVYNHRVSDEFMYASEEEQMNYLKEFGNAIEPKIARALDIGAFLGLNPKTGTASAVIGSNSFSAKVNNSITFDATTPDDNIEAAIALIDFDADINGLAASKEMKAALADLKDRDGGYLYPELRFGQNPDELHGLPTDFNSTVSFNGALLRAVVGDFQNKFRWGVAKDITLEIIEYGDPDNTGSDLKGHNQVCLRAEIYLGWAILDPDAFAMINA